MSECVSASEGPLQEKGQALSIRILVAPRASKSALAGLHDGRLKVRIAAPPVDGAANQELVRFVAAQLGVSRAQVELVQGASSKRKTLRVEGVDATLARQRLGLDQP